MKRYAALLLLMPCLLCACATTEALNTYERDELVSVRHNNLTGCTLLIYRDPVGQVHHVFRRHGVFELALTYTTAGEIELRERGRQERRIESHEAYRVTRHIHSLLEVEQTTQEEPSNNLSTI